MVYVKLGYTGVVFSVSSIPEAPRGLAVGVVILEQPTACAPIIMLEESAVHGVRAFELPEVVGKGAVRILFALREPDS